jgi:serine/threonine-protein kinase
MIDHDTAPGDASGLRQRAEQSVAASDGVEGQTLRSLLQRAIRRGESIPQAIGLRIVLDLAEAMAIRATSQAPATGAADGHRPLAPELVHVADDGRARRLERAAGPARGAPSSAYMAPEHIAGSRNVDARSDVFELGLLLWEMLACRSLFGAVTDEEERERVLAAPARVQRDQFMRGEPIAAALAKLVARALQRDPDQRFQSYQEFADALVSAELVAEHEQVAELVREGMRESAAAAAVVSSIAAADVTAQVDVTEILLSAAACADRAEPTETRRTLVSAPEDVSAESPADGDAAAGELVQAESGPGEHRRTRSRVVVVATLAVLAVLGWVALRRTDTPAAAPARSDDPSAAAAPSRAAPARHSEALRGASSARPSAAPPGTAAPARREPPSDLGRESTPAGPEGARGAISPAPGKTGARNRAASRGRARAAEFVPDDI